MARFVLVHGAWHGGWCWEEIQPRLEALGHIVRAPDLPGMGADCDSGHISTLDDWAMYIAGMSSGQDEPAILVGHSRGGIVISRAAEFAPAAVRRLVYLAGVMATPGETMAELFDNPALVPSSPMAYAVSPSNEGASVTLHSRDTAVHMFYGTTPADRAEVAFSRLTPEPSSMRTTPVLLSDDRYGSVPRSYIYCEMDRSVPPALQRHMVARQPCDVYSLETDHSPFYSAPDALVAILQQIAANR